jgi:hypothetical protein
MVGEGFKFACLRLFLDKFCLDPITALGSPCQAAWAASFSAEKWNVVELVMRRIFRYLNYL